MSKLSELSNGQKSRRLAEKLEPNPIPYAWADGDNFPRRLSKLGAWVFYVSENPSSRHHFESCAYLQGLSCDCYGDGPIGDQKRPRDFVNDPAMTLMLQERWIANGFHFTAWPNENGIRLHLSDGLGTLIQQTSPTFRQAVVDVSMLQMGWKEE